MFRLYTSCSIGERCLHSKRYILWRLNNCSRYVGFPFGHRAVATVAPTNRKPLRGKVVEKVSLEQIGSIQQALEPLLDDRKRRAASVSNNGVKNNVESVLSQNSDLPQGLIEHENGQDENPQVESSVAIYPPVIQQARNNMRKFENCVVLTRVGSFYELYFEQAEEYASLLNIKLSSKRTTAGLVSMAGFPFYQLDRYLKILVQELGKHVAVSEEIANEPAQKVKSGGLLFDRQVTRVITPGTLIDENFLHPYQHNYLLAIHLDDSLVKNSPDHTHQALASVRVGLSWLDLSSGDFFTQSTDIRALPSVVARIGPPEVILSQDLENPDDNRLMKLLGLDNCSVSFHAPTKAPMTLDQWSSMLDEDNPTIAPDTFTSEEMQSANLLLHYIKTQLPGFKMKLQSPVHCEASDCMIIDKNSLKCLEIIETMRDGFHKGSLLQAIRRTSTASGARLLAQRLTFPSMSIKEINHRLDLVDQLMSTEVLLERITDLLKQSSDTLRLLQKFSFGRGDAEDLLQLCKTIKIIEDIDHVITQVPTEDSPLYHLHNKFQLDAPRVVAHRIVQAIDEEGLIMRQRVEDAATADVVGEARSVLETDDNSNAPELSDLRKSLATKRFDKASNRDTDRPSADDIWIMRRNATSTMERLHEKLDQLITTRDQLELSLRQELNADSLSLKFTPGLGHICHVRGKDMKLTASTLSNVRTVSSTKSTRSFYLPDWTRLGTSIDDAKLRIRREEQTIFQALRAFVIQNLVTLRKNASVLDELDIACSSAMLAIEHDLKRPKLNYSHDHTIIGGRHMMVEVGLMEAGRQFIPNDCILDNKERIWLITGPNMAGKSTFLRQTALISILAQTGMYVPAEYVEVGMVDQIFSRVGSADNLSQDQSTFMVEMLETAHILRNATSRSFVIMDEVGRGTTPEDGIAVGYAVLHQLQHIIQCRTLFATHFHALADMTKDFSSLACYCTNVVDEPGGSFRFDHRVRKGVNRNSHALKVAMLADMPSEVIEKAGEVLEQLRKTPPQPYASQ